MNIVAAQAKLCSSKDVVKSWAKISRKLCLISMFISGVTACTVFPAQERPIVPPTTTGIISSPTIPTVAPSPSVTPALTPMASVQCKPLSPPSEDSSLPLPKLATLQWENVVIDQQMVRRIGRLSLEPTAFTFAHTGNQVAIALQPSRSVRSAVAIVSFDDTSSWWVTQDDNINLSQEPLPLSTWLPSGEPLWVDESGMVRVGSGTTANAIETPVPMSKILYVIDEIAVVTSQESNRLWWLNLVTEAWAPITSSDGTALAATGNQVQLANDFSYLLIVGSEQVWRVPVEMGAEAETIPIEPYDVIGSGQAPSPPVQLGDSAYWLVRLPIQPTEPLTIGSQVRLQEGFIINTEDGSHLTLAELPIPTTYDFLLGFALSEDGEWVGISAASRRSAETGTLRQAVYITRAGSLDQGHLLENVKLVALLAAPATLVAQDLGTGELVAYPLPYSEETNPYPLPGVSEILTVAPNRMYAYMTSDPAQIVALDTQGNKLASLTLSPPYSSYSTVVAKDDLVLISVAYPDETGNCLYDIVAWHLP